jgi:hypothetical protein
MDDTADDGRGNRAGLVVLGAMGLALVLLARRSPLGPGQGAFTQPPPLPVPPLQPLQPGMPADASLVIAAGAAGYAANPGGFPAAQTTSFGSPAAMASSPGGFPLVSTSFASAAPQGVYAQSPGGYPLAQTVGAPAAATGIPGTQGPVYSSIPPNFLATIGAAGAPPPSGSTPGTGQTGTPSVTGTQATGTVSVSTPGGSRSQ